MSHIIRFWFQSFWAPDNWTSDSWALGRLAVRFSRRTKGHLKVCFDHNRPGLIERWEVPCVQLSRAHCLSTSVKINSWQGGGSHLGGDSCQLLIDLSTCAMSTATSRPYSSCVYLYLFCIFRHLYQCICVFSVLAFLQCQPSSPSQHFYSSPPCIDHVLANSCIYVLYVCIHKYTHLETKTTVEP